MQASNPNRDGRTGASELGLDELPRLVVAHVRRLVHPETADERERLLRLLEIGFLPGEKVRVMAHGYPGRDPVAVRVGHTTFALRRHEAALVRVMPVGSDS